MTWTPRSRAVPLRGDERRAGRRGHSDRVALPISHSDGRSRVARFHVCAALPAGGQWAARRRRSAGAALPPRRVGPTPPPAKRYFPGVARLLPEAPRLGSRRDGGAPGRPPPPDVVIVGTHAERDR